jgi:hypothetical protein
MPATDLRRQRMPEWGTDLVLSRTDAGYEVWFEWDGERHSSEPFLTLDRADRFFRRCLESDDLLARERFGMVRRDQPQAVAKVA